MGAAYHITPADREYDKRRSLAWAGFCANVLMGVPGAVAFENYRNELVMAWQEWSDHFAERG